MVWLDRSFVINTHLDKQDLYDTQTVERQEVVGCKGTSWTSLTYWANTSATGEPPHIPVPSWQGGVRNG